VVVAAQLQALRKEGDGRTPQHTHTRATEPSGLVNIQGWARRGDQRVFRNPRAS